MAYINQPPDLRTIQADLTNRLRLLETATRFTAPNVSTDPTNARTGDIWYNTVSNKLKSLLTTVVELVTTGVANTFTALQTFSAGLTVSSGTLTATAVTSNLGTTNTGTLTSGTTNTGTLGVTGNATISGNFIGQSGGATNFETGDANGSIELGKTNGTGTTPFIDFHAGATATDYDVRLIASGGTGVTGQGTLQMVGGRFNLQMPNVNLVSIATAVTIGAAGGAAALPATPLGYIIIEIGGTQRKIPFYNV
jgi:hypothetical protein